MNIIVRPAVETDLPAVNVIREMVNRLHAEGRPDFFRQDFNNAIRLRVYQAFFAEDSDVICAEIDGTICGFATVQYVVRPENAYMNERRFYRVEEFGVSENYRRMGVATALIEYIRKDAREKGYPSVELDMWEFNQKALAFYEAVGFKTYRRYMEIGTDAH